MQTERLAIFVLVIIIIVLLSYENPTQIQELTQNDVEKLEKRNPNTQNKNEILNNINNLLLEKSKSNIVNIETIENNVTFS